MTSRSFVGRSTVTASTIDLALAPALTPTGVLDNPSFFRGFATHPQVLSRGLLVLADVTATRYVQFVPTGQRDPVLTANGDRLRAEVFSACNSVYARLDVLSAGLDGGEIASGTTNVDVGMAMRQSLASVGRAQLLHLNVGDDGLRVSSLDSTVVERPVEMPDRWVRALGNAAEMHHQLTHSFTVGAAEAKRFVAALSAATGAHKSGWMSVQRGTLRASPRMTSGAVHVDGMHRLSAVKRMLLHVEGLTVYGPADQQSGAAVLEFHLPAARLVIGLTADSWRGYSGEGSLLTALGAESAALQADEISALLAFEPVISVDRLVRESGLSEQEVRAALAVLASSGRVGWDLHEEAYFHRELPSAPERVARDNPRLVAARRLAESGAVRAKPNGTGWAVRSGDRAYLVRSGGDRFVSVPPKFEGDATSLTCTCTWYLTHSNTRGPCKHALAVQLLATAQAGTVTH